MSGPSHPPNPGRPETSVNEATPLQRAIAALEKMKGRLDAMERAASEPIAIVGMSCRFPGGGEGIEAFWRVLDEGIDAIREIPPSRWPIQNNGDPKTDVRWAGLLDDVETFDAAFFGISPREAESLDPQQRMLLEVTWNALEDAGLRPDRLVGSRTGVFIGICGNDYRFLVSDARDDQYDAYCATGSMLCTAAGRISFFMGFQGPALSIDTGCSASLVAIAQGCQSLRSGDSDCVIAGGVNALLSRAMMAMAAQTQALSPDGRCKTLDARANGFVRGEGCGILVLKRLSDAIRDGDRIHGLIRGWAVNQDGRSTGLTTPNVLSQQAMLRQALERAKLSPADIDYVELHGTGTSLGDPIEAEALRAVYGGARKNGRPCVLGAAKTNIGHTEGAAGAAGVIKALLALKHERIPKNLHFRQLNPRISFEDGSFTIPTQKIPWTRGVIPRRAGVSSFGISGTNAHIVLEEPPIAQEKPIGALPSTYLLPLSAKTPKALEQLVAAHARWLPTTEIPMHQIVHTAAVRRMHHEARIAITAQTREDLATSLAQLAEAPNEIHAAAKFLHAKPKVVFVFPGQGSQWVGMGRRLLAEEPVFRSTLETLDARIREESGFSILSEIAKEEDASAAMDIDVIQPLLFAIEVALAALWRSWGIEPDCVVGHSMGEVAAALVAGYLSTDDATRIICRRSKLLKSIRGRGAMALVELPIAEAERTIAGLESKLSIAVNNGPRSTVIAGDPRALEDILIKLEAKGIFCRRIKVDVASHSPQVDPLRAPLLQALQGISPLDGRIPMRSTVTSKALTAGGLSADYFWHNLREPVHFSSVTQDLLREGHHVFIEMSPHPILLPAIEENFRELRIEGAALASMRRNTDEKQTILQALGALYSFGYDIDWAKLYPFASQVVSLPNYPWQRERFWVETSRRVARSNMAKREHPFVETRIESSALAQDRVFQGTLSVDDVPYLAEHCLGDLIIVPGTAYLELALYAASTIMPQSRIILEDIQFIEPLILKAGQRVLIEAILKTNGEEWQYEFHSREETSEPALESNSAWRLHAKAKVMRGSEPSTFTGPSLGEFRRSCQQPVDAATVANLGVAQGLRFGPAFLGLREVWQGQTDVVGRVVLPESISAGAADYLVHPALLDAALRIQGLGMPMGRGPHVLAVIRRLEWHRRAGTAVWNGLAKKTNDAETTNELTLFNDEGQMVLSLSGLEMRPVVRTDIDPHAELYYAQDWTSTPPLLGGQKARGRWLVLCDEEGAGEELANTLRSLGANVSCLWAKTELEIGAGERRRIDPRQAEEIATCIANELSATDPLTNIVYCWGLAYRESAQLTTKDLELAQLLGCGGALHVVKALLQIGPRHMPKLWLMTRCTQNITSSVREIQIAQAPLWGLGRTIAMECPELRCARIDLDAPNHGEQSRLLVHELLSDTNEEEIVFRDETRYVGRLARQKPSYDRNAKLPISADATYLITGGLGGLGLLAAHALATHGARQVVLMSRQGVATAEQAADIAEIEKLGATISIVRGDVTQAEDVARILSDIEAQMPPLRGILHTAGVLEDGALLNQSIERFRRVFGPKMLGTWNLHQQTQKKKLDFFLLYSSLSAILGPPGLSNYVAANTFLDALAHYRRNLHLPATSINWGLIADKGMASKAQSAGRVEEQGVIGMSASTYESLLVRALSAQWVQMGLAEVNFRAWRERFPQVVSLHRFDSLLESLDTMVVPAKHKNTQLLEAFVQATAADRIAMLEKFVREQLAAILRLDPKRIELRAPLRTLGIDSLMSLELRNRLETALGLELSATLVWSHPHVTALADHLSSLLSAKEAAVEPQAPEPVRETVTPAPPQDEATTRDGDHLLLAFDQSMKRIRNRRRP